MTVAPSCTPKSENPYRLTPEATAHLAQPPAHFQGSVPSRQTRGRLRRPFSVCRAPERAARVRAGTRVPGAPAPARDPARVLRPPRPAPSSRLPPPSSAWRPPAPSLRRAPGSVSWHFLQPGRAAGGPPRARPGAPSSPHGRSAAGGHGRGRGPGGTRERPGRGPGRGPQRPRQKGPGASSGSPASGSGIGGAPRRSSRSPGIGAQPRGPRQGPALRSPAPARRARSPGVAWGPSRAPAGGAGVWERRAQPGSPLDAARRSRYREGGGRDICLE